MYIGAITNSVVQDIVIYNNKIETHFYAYIGSI